MTLRRFVVLLPLFLLLLGTSSCRTLRRVPENRSLLVQNKIIIDNSKVDVEEMRSYIKQKPNRRILDFGVRGYPLYLHIYNQVDSLKQDERHKKSAARMDAKNLKIIAHNQHVMQENTTRSRKHQKKQKELLTVPRRRLTEAFCDWLLDIGEAPVLLDTSLTDRTVRQLHLFLGNKGYFNSTVDDTTIYVQKFRDKIACRIAPKKHPQKKYKRKAIVHYRVKTGQPYTIRNVSYEVEDELLKYFFLADNGQTLLKPGSNYDVDVLQQERDRITLALKNNGYYFFTKEFITYSADSALNSHQLDLTVNISKQFVLQPDSSVIKTDHVRYYIRNIYIITDFVPREKPGDIKRDTIIYEPRDKMFLLSKGRIAFRPSTLATRVAFQSRQLYQENNYEKTYKDLTNLRNFKQVGIEMRPWPGGHKDSLDCYIRLLPSKRQSYITQIEGTNTGGNLGISGSFVYQNNNVFRGAEVLEVRLRGGTEAQRLVSNITGQTGEQQLTFNTIEFGPDISLTFPRAFFPFSRPVFPFTLLKEENVEGRRTVFQGSFNYQRRVDYTRTIGNLAYGYTERLGRANGPKTSRLAFYPIEINVVQASLSEALFHQLVANHDQLLLYRFTDHLTNDMRLSYVLNTQDLKKRGNVLFLKVDLETSGIGTRQLFEHTSIEPDNTGSYRIAGIRFSQYYRYFFDIRYYRDLGPNQQLVLRAAHGLGVPLKNFSTLPLEKSFFGGGANGIRAWESRSLGPGTYNVPVELKYVQFGDLQIEYNAELRFKITKTLKGAVFGDGGNIWLLKADTTRPGGEFIRTNPLKNVNAFAFGAGIGLRFDLSFFILRLDAAAPLRDPAFPAGQRWLLSNDGALKRTNFNFGIGYPF